jgi:DNA-binding beta-propeller fold protein YncE
MLLTLVLFACQNPQPTQTLSLVGSQRDDDLPTGMHFTPNGARLVVHNGFESGFASLTEIDVATGTVVARSDDFVECNSIAVSPDGRIALVPEEYTGKMHVLALPGLQTIATVDLTQTTGNDHFRAAVDSTGTRAVLSNDSTQRVWVVDLATATQERIIPLTGSQLVWDPRLGIDDRSLPVREASDVVTLDITTGLESARASVTPPGTVWRLSLSGDGTVLAALVRDVAANAFYVERFTIPGLARLGWIQVSTTSAVEYLQLDDDGDRVLLGRENGTIVLDVVSGVQTTLVGLGYSALLDATGTKVFGANGPDIVVADATSGATLGSFPPRGRDFHASNWMVLSPDGRFAAATRMRSDRIEVFDLTGAAPVRIVDVSSGFGEEADGPYGLALTADGKRALVVGRDSDDLRVVTIDGPAAVLGRVTLDSGPEAVALRPDGMALVVHGRGSSLSVVDIDVLVELLRIPLPDAAYFVQPELQGNAAWVLVDGAASRSLVRVDTASGVVLATVTLPGGAGVTSTGRELLPTVQFDLRRARAFVASPDTGELALVDLSAASVVSTVPVRTVMEPAEVTLRSDGSIVYHRGSTTDVSVFDVTPQGLLPRWSSFCGTTSPMPSQRSLLTLFGDEQHLLVLGGCTSGLTVHDASTGAISSGPAWNGGAQHMRAFGDEVWIDASGAPIFRYRANGAVLGLTGLEGTTMGSSVLAFAPETGRAVGLADDVANQWTPPVDRFYVLDLVQDTLQCTPSVPNSTGSVATLRTDGRGFAGAPLIVTVEGLQPGAMVGYLLAGSATAPPTPLGSGVGELCLGGSIARFVHQVQAADVAGRQRFVVDTAAIPTATGPMAVQPGSTWVFQSWHRDTTAGGASTSNTSTARAVRFD